MDVPKKLTKKNPLVKPKIKTQKNFSEPSKAEQARVTNIVKQAVDRHKAEMLADRKAQFKEIGQLSSIAEEYLSCFSIIGYSLQGERVCIFNATTAKDEAALVDLLRSTFLDIVNNRP
ncbi:MAG: hypothetical protein RL709_82 [Pseudomonadota bacterium]|jgi:hypothetical protein